MKDNTY